MMFCWILEERTKEVSPDVFRAYEKPVTTISTTDCEDSSPGHVVSTSSSDQQQQHLEMGDHVGYLSYPARKPLFKVFK